MVLKDVSGVRLSLRRQMACQASFYCLPHIFHYVEAIGTLNRLGSTSSRGRGVVSPAIPAHQLDFWVRRHPSSGRLCGPISKDIQNGVCSEIDDDRTKLASAPEGKVVDANLWHLSHWFCGQGHDAPENGLPRCLNS